MGYTTFKNLCQWVAEAVNKDAVINRKSVVSLANLTRQHIYLLYAEVQTVVDVESCFEVQSFPAECNQCEEDYIGVTLPHDMQNVEVCWRNNRPAQLFSKWRESVMGIQKSESCRVQVFDLGSIFPTERDHGATCKLMVKANLRDDIGKVFNITYINHEGVRVEQNIKLTLEYQQTRDPVKSIIRPGGIVLPEGRVGGISLSSNEKIISIYSPYESAVPAYKRVKITGVNCGDQVLIKSARRYVPLFFDADVTEVDNALAVREIAKGIFFGDAKQAQAGWEQKSEFHLARGKKYLIGEQSRDQGKNVIRQFFVGGRQVNRSGLNRRRR